MLNNILFIFAAGRMNGLKKYQAPHICFPEPISLDKKEILTGFYADQDLTILCFE
jgi:hypothetical protein